MEALLLFAAQAAERPLPTLRGPHFACRMTDRSGEAFTVSGSLGEGRRRNPSHSERHPVWNYHYARARIEDGQAGFSGAPIFARSTTDPQDLRVTMRYAAGRNAREIHIGEGGHARLTEGNSGDVIADGTCHLVFAPRVASSQAEKRR